MLREIIDNRLKEFPRARSLALLGKQPRQVASGPQEIETRALSPSRRDRLGERLAGVAAAILSAQQTPVQPAQLRKHKDVAVLAGNLDSVRQGLLGRLGIADDEDGFGQQRTPQNPPSQSCFPIPNPLLALASYFTIGIFVRSMVIATAPIRTAPKTMF
jgi:hypothetical protein